MPEDTTTGDPHSLVNRRVGNFVVQRLLGEGAMGSVFLGVHDTLDRKVAIKVLKPHLARNEGLVQRFMDEARIVSGLGHRGIAQIFDFGRLEDGQFYATMEYLEGKDLDNALLREGPMSPSRVASIGVQVCAALAAVHDRDVVHRDLKPANLFLAIDSGGIERVKILDFGIAKLDHEHASGNHARTALGHIVGTPDYMAPEQAKAQSAVCGRTDIYSLGCVLYELLCGDPPFDADSVPGLLVAHATQEPPPIDKQVDGLPAGLGAIVMRCLRKEPGDRWPDARQLKQALMPYASELPDGVTTGIQTGVELVPLTRRRVWPYFLGTASALLVLVFIFSRVGDSGGTPKSSEESTAESAVLPTAEEDPTAESMRPEKAIGREPAKGASNPYTVANNAVVAEGAIVFTTHCASCHGGDGKGDGTLAPVNATPRAFSNLRVEPGLLDSYRYAVLRRGVGEMPAFAQTLSEKDSWKVITYLSAMGANGTPVDANELWDLQAPALTKRMEGQGQTIFTRECQSCHGRKGHGYGPAAGYLGRRPADLALGQYKLRTTDRDSLPTSEDIFRTLTEGMGVSGMPAFSKLDESERWALVAFLRTLSPRFRKEAAGEVLTIPLPPGFDTAAERRGAATYLAAGCAQCHGEEGRGDGPKASTLLSDRGDSILPANFSVPSTFVGGRSPRELYRTLMTGVAGTPMPAGDDFFDEAEAWDVIAYILSLDAGDR